MMGREEKVGTPPTGDDACVSRTSRLQNQRSSGWGWESKESGGKKRGLGIREINHHHRLKSVLTNMVMVTGSKG